MAVTTDLQKPRAGPGGPKPSWGLEGLFRTMAEAEHSHLREWPDVEPEQCVKCQRCCPGLLPGCPGAALFPFIKELFPNLPSNKH